MHTHRHKHTQTSNTKIQNLKHNLNNTIKTCLVKFIFRFLLFKNSKSRSLTHGQIDCTKYGLENSEPNDKFVYKTIFLNFYRKVRK